MPVISASAPGKAILFGEHAVVYGRPAIAVPINQIQAKVTIQAEPNWPVGKVHISAPDIQLEIDLKDLTEDDPIAIAVTGAMNVLSINHLPALKMRITSSIPIAAGLGSGAAVSVAIIRALSGFLGHLLPDETVSSLAYQVEQKHHGIPSGIDNSVIAYSVPIYFIRGLPIEILSVHEQISLVIADSGIASPTILAVNQVKNRVDEKPQLFQDIFDRIGEISRHAREIILHGHTPDLGPLMNENHHLLKEIGVSNEKLDSLVQTAIAAGAVGAKLSGGGMGGNIIALVTRAYSDRVCADLNKAGAVNIFNSSISGPLNVRDQ